MAQEQDPIAGAFTAARSEADFDHAAIGPLAVDFDPASESAGTRGNKRSARVHGGLLVGGRFGANQRLDQPDKRGLLSTRSGQERSHGDGFVRHDRFPRSLQRISY